MLPRAIACILALGCAVLLQAQPRATARIRHGTTDIVDITLTRKCDVAEVWVVRDGRDGERFRAKPDSSNPCHWTATLPDGTYNTKLSRFSLRLRGRARSECMQAEWRPGTRLGHLVYPCCSGGYTYDVSVSYGNIVPYAREIKGCTERGEVPGTGPETDRTIHDVQFEIEDLRLDVVPGKPAPCNLIVDDLPSVRTLPKGRPLTIPRGETAMALRKQDVRGDNCHPAIISVPNIEIRERLALRPVEIKVK